VPEDEAAGAPGVRDRDATAGAWDVTSSGRLADSVDPLEPEEPELCADEGPGVWAVSVTVPGVRPTTLKETSEVPSGIGSVMVDSGPWLDVWASGGRFVKATEPPFSETAVRVTGSVSGAGIGVVPVPV
jgi:hypothetical protein